MKDVRTKSQEIEPTLLFAKCPHWLDPVRTHHKFRKKVLKFFAPKVRTSASEEHPFHLVRTGHTPSFLTADVFY